MLIEKPYVNRGIQSDGILYGYEYAKLHRVENAIFLCVPSSDGIGDVDLNPGDFRFFKVEKGVPIEVPPTRNFFTGKRFIDPKNYLKR